MKYAILAISLLFTAPAMAGPAFQFEWLGVISTLDGGATQRGDIIIEYTEPACEASRSAQRKLYRKMANMLGFEFTGRGAGNGSDTVAFTATPCRAVHD